MLYHLLFPLREYFFAFNVFKYITFRAAFASVTAMIIVILLGPLVIRMLYSMKIGQRIRKEECLKLYSLHKEKEGVPTMGGILIIVSVLFSTLLWADIFNLNIIIVTGAFLWLGAIGFWDDYIKIKKKRSLGLTAKMKFFLQLVLAVAIGLIMVFSPEMKLYGTVLTVPFFKEVIFYLGPFIILFIAIVVVGSSNAVNLTDGLDGLAIGCVIIASLALGVMSYVTGHAAFARYLQLIYIPGSGELAVFCASIVGAGLGFLWFNCYPAQVFMGDTGSLSLGGALGVVAILIKKELVLFIVGGVFVIEALSVMIQVLSFKMTGKRVFRCAPIHHHYEMKGLAEPKVTIRFWIVAIICALISIAALKLQ
ncbi:MAG: phospho-N-acetylmuramoyl-pentapeptide-transferase [Candidatus Ancaeobacter aquaticus]|nr:phospho-N-acetylmuramoyl-pentapeptide-transferase [Candidatus Ancaeobacter aquaticus]